MRPIALHSTIITSCGARSCRASETIREEKLMPPTPDNLHEPPGTGVASVAVPEEPLRRLEQVLGETIPPLILQARQAFRRDLPCLLAEHSRKWVAYSGDRRIGMGSSKTPLYQECLRRGLTPAQFLVLSIEPERPREVEIPRDV